ncbi:MAG TPA: sigma-70 family RNA polymerase sigma factor [Saprospiraceae bacterium]|nr:sigma-70 family RNA polymerase sigma factor [Saprospiraceae bacterium]
MHQDQRYIEGLLNNDHVIIKEIYTTFSDKIKGLVLKNNGNVDDARDVFQEALIAIHRNAQSGLVLQCPFDAYFYVVCKRKWLNMLKKNRRQEVTIHELEGYEGAEVQIEGTQMHHLQTEREDFFWQVFQDLGDKCQKLLRLGWSGLSMQDVAVKMGMTYGYARRRKTLCAQQLIEMVKKSPGFSQLKEL